MGSCTVDTTEENNSMRYQIFSPVGFKSRGCHGGELGVDCENTVEFAVGKRRGYASGDAGEDSVTVSELSRNPSRIGVPNTLCFPW